ncbi:MAG TPA: tail fiber domain-containing protein, partial [Saprospiraceae bacterium]|nr:tail fiber domain-containing protein [Saprospiraceae bacterium]
KIVLYESQNNDHEFYGFGINGSILRYQVPPGTNHVFYAGVDAANSIELMRKKANGNVGIGISVPTEKLHVNGNGLFTGTVTASCGLLICSDMRYKIKATALNNALQKVMALNGIYYYWDKEHFPEKNFTDDRQVGVSAQELETVLPELVHTDADGYKTVDYSRLTPVLIEAVKEQQRQIEELKQQVKMLVELMTPSSSVKSE